VVQLDGVWEMTDKELIKLAAKAAGISKQWARSSPPHSGHGPFLLF